MRYESMQEASRGADVKATARNHAVDVGIMEGMIDIIAMVMGIVVWRKTRRKPNDGSGFRSEPKQGSRTELLSENKEYEHRVMNSEANEPVIPAFSNTGPSETYLVSRIELRLENESRKCPACAETIKLQALKCRYCQERFDPKEVEALVAERRNIWNQQAAGPITCPKTDLS